MKKGTNKIIIVFTVLSLMLATLGLSVFAKAQVSITNKFSMGVVDIELIEYKLNQNGNRIPYEDYLMILPGQNISKIQNINNLGNDCYVRVKYIFTNGFDKYLDNSIYGISDKWIKAEDGYYYYTDIVETGSNIDFFEGFLVPTDLPQKETEGKNFSLKIETEAIQSQNFEPDFASEDPWHNIEIEEFIQNGIYDIEKNNERFPFNITYDGETDILSANIDDFFSNINNLLPGDIYEDSFDIKNNSNSEIKLFFRTNNQDYNDLLDKINLIITTNIDGDIKTFYDGDLRSKELEKEDVLLGLFKAHSTGTVTFKISVPAELPNEYTLNNSFVKWEFSAERTSNISSILTGDMSNIGLILFILGAAFGILTLAIYKRNKSINTKNV